MPPPGHPLESAPTDTPSPTTMSTDSDAGTREGALAAVDLGSNSFHMIVAESLGGEPLVIDRLREQVQLGAGLDAEGRLDEAAIERGLACLQLFGQRLAHCVLQGTEARVFFDQAPAQGAAAQVQALCDLFHVGDLPRRLQQ